jgi:nicotinamidase-related amidase
MKSLVIIDFQYDFCDPKGSLYVKGAEEAKKGIINYMEKNHQSFNQIIYTRDWHLDKDESFKKNGGIWPDHCVQNSKGAEIDKELYDNLAKYKIDITIVNKGTVPSHEEYGAFENIKYEDEKNKTDINNCLFSNYELSSGAKIVNNNIVVCGIAGDYCVKESIKNLLKHWNFKLEVLTTGVASIDNGDTLKAFMKEKKLSVAN